MDDHSRTPRAWLGRTQGVQGGSSPLLGTGRAQHQGPEVDGTTTVRLAEPRLVGDLVRATVVASEGVDLVAVEPGRS